MRRSLLGAFITTVVSTACFSCSGASTDDVAAEDTSTTEKLSVPGGVKLWTGGLQGAAQVGSGTTVIPVCWAKGIESTGGGNPVPAMQQPNFAQLQRWTWEALQAGWEGVANIKFTGWQQCSSNVSTDYATGKLGPMVMLRWDTSSEPQNGVTAVGMQTNQWTWSRLPPSSNESYFKATLLHELGHALGFQHESDRPENPTFPANPCARGMGGEGISGGPYDYYSIMNFTYPCANDSAGGLQAANGIFVLSPLDVVEIQSLYGRKPTAGITAYWDSRQSTEFVVYPSTSSLLGSLSCGPGGCWNSTTLNGGWLPYPGLSLTSVFDGTQPHLFFNALAVSGERFMAEYHGEPLDPNTGSPRTTKWEDLGAHAAFWDGHVYHVFYADPANGDLHEAYNDGSWSDHTITKCPYNTMETGPHNISAYWDGSVEHVVYTCINTTALVPAQELWETYYNGSWWSHSIASTASGGVSPSSKVSGASAYGLQGILGIGPAGSKTVVYTSFTSSQGWKTVSIPVPSASANSTTLVYADSAGLRYFFTGADFHVYEVQTPGGTPYVIDLSTAAHGGDGSLAGGANSWGSDLAGFSDGTNDHVFFIGSDGNVHEFYGGINDARTTWWEHPISSGGTALHP